MITEIVVFRLPEGMSRDDAVAKYRLTIPIWQANPDLIRKAFLFDEASRQGGGVNARPKKRRISKTMREPSENLNRLEPIR